MAMAGVRRVRRLDEQPERVGVGWLWRGREYADDKEMRVALDGAVLAGRAGRSLWFGYESRERWMELQGLGVDDWAEVSILDRVQGDFPGYTIRLLRPAPKMGGLFWKDQRFTDVKGLEEALLERNREFGGKALRVFAGEYWRVLGSSFMSSNKCAGNLVG